MPGTESRSLLPQGLRWAGPLLAPLYGLGVRIHRAISKKQFAPIATICVGNLTAGGTGKTPAVIYFARGLCERGRKPAILMRGYKAQGSDEGEEVKTALREWDVPILLGADRHASAIKAREMGSDVALLDDGFQHWGLARDLDIVLLDATDLLGGEALIPAGRLREHSKGLGRAGVVILTRSNLVSERECANAIGKIKSIAPQASVFISRHGPAALRELNGARMQMPLEELKGKRVVAACGIGNPGAFQATLEKTGAQISEFAPFDDHHDFSQHDVGGLEVRAIGGSVVVTEKDAVKIQKLKLSERVNWLALGIEFQVDEPKELWARIEAALRAGDERAGFNRAR